MSSVSQESLDSVYTPLRLVYGIVPIAAGADKFLNLLTDWQRYLPAPILEILPVSGGAFMQLVGVIEIVAGLAVLSAFTRFGAYVVTAWLVLIASNLAIGGYFDIAVRDLVMAAGAYTLARLAALRDEKWVRGVFGARTA